jgi:hypothetical protein
LCIGEYEDAARRFYALLKDEDEVEEVFGEFLASATSLQQRASQCRGASQDIRTIQELLGHNHLDMTMIHTRVLHRGVGVHRPGAQSEERRKRHP